MIKSELRLPKSVKSVTFLRPDPDGAGRSPVTVYAAKAKRKKSTRALKAVEKWARRTTEAQAAYADTYLKRHRRSNTKKRDGWMRDYAYNMAKAYQRGGKRLKLLNLLGW
jgi:hypothetical protein